MLDLRLDLGGRSERSEHSSGTLAACPQVATLPVGASAGLRRRRGRYRPPCGPIGGIAQSWSWTDRFYDSQIRRSHSSTRADVGFTAAYSDCSHSDPRAIGLKATVAHPGTMQQEPQTRQVPSCYRARQFPTTSGGRCTPGSRNDMYGARIP